MTTYAQEIDEYGSFDENSPPSKGDIKKTQREQRERLRIAIPDLFPMLEAIERNPEMKDRFFEMILNY